MEIEHTNKRKLSKEEIRAILKKAGIEPLIPPKPKKIQIIKSCENCQDYIVCYAYEKLKTADEAKNCEDWHLSLEEYEKLYDEAETNNAE